MIENHYDSSFSVQFNYTELLVLKLIIVILLIPIKLKHNNKYVLDILHVLIISFFFLFQDEDSYKVLKNKT